MGRLNDSFTVLTLAVVAGVYLKPEYAIYDSRVLTLVLIFATYAFSKILYILVLYPAFFTPLKAIPTPGVSVRFSHTSAKLLTWPMW